MTARSTLLTLAMAVALAACAGTDAAAPAGATCSEFESAGSIEQSRTIDAGTDLSVVLCSNPSTGFSWGDPAIGDATVLELADRTYRAADTGSLPIVGAAGGEVFTIHGVNAGTTTFSIAFGQPWTEGIHEAWTYQLTVTVR